MSKENVDAFRRVLETVDQENFGPRVVELADPEVVWRSFFAALLPAGEYHGHQGVLDWARDIQESWEELRVEVDDVLDAGDVVVGIGRVVYRGKGSGVASSSEAGWVMRFRAGKVLRFRAFRDPVDALEAVGLSE